MSGGRTGVTHHTSHVTRHTSHFTHHTNLEQYSHAYAGRKRSCSSGTLPLLRSLLFCNIFRMYTKAESIAADVTASTRKTRAEYATKASGL